MDAGKLNEKLSLLKYDDGNWQQISVLWGSALQNDKNNIFSSVGIGARNVEFVIRRREISLHNALQWRGRHCFLTGITDEGRGHLRVTAALIEPVVCRSYRSIITHNENRNPVHTLEPLFEFKACVTEKYMGFMQQQPQAQIKETLVLVTPKSVELKMGDIVEISGFGKYAVTLPHTIDEFKNEYEAQRTKEG